MVRTGRIWFFFEVLFILFLNVSNGVEGFGLLRVFVEFYVFGKVDLLVVVDVY